MKRTIYTILLLICVVHLFAQRIDFNMTGRNEEEVNEPNYVAWAVNMSASESKTFDNGVTVTLAATGAADVLRSQWNKNTCTQGKNGITGLRLLGDGVVAFKLDDDNNTPNITNQPTGIAVTVEGLPSGKHSLLAYHVYKDVLKTVMPQIKVEVDGKEVLTGVKFSNITDPASNLKMSEAACSYVEFNVAEGQPVIITYSTMVEEGKEYQSTNITLNGLEFDTSPFMAQDPWPDNYEYHVDADDGTCPLQWTASSVATIHKLVFGTDAQDVATSTAYQYEGIATSYTVSGLTPLKRYYWRVDEVEENGTIHKGTVWEFQPRRLAFPGAEGYGRFAIGGRGGVVYHVTTLDDNGDDNNPLEGSLRYGIKKVSGPRTIVFDVAGVISLKSRLTCSDKYVTIAGQTAPGHGILLRTCAFGMQTDGITRFLRMRLGHKKLVNGVIPGSNNGQSYGADAGKTEETTLGGVDGMGMAGNDNAIMDHCSISWTIDEAFSSRGAKAITLQHTLISEALNVAGHPNYSAGNGHGYAATIGGGQMGGKPGSFHHNLLTHNAGRNWSISGGLDGKGFYDGAHDVFNNVVYNWDGRTTDGGTHEMNFVNNYYKVGPADGTKTLFTAQLEGTGQGSQSYYVNGNIRDNKNGSLTQDKYGETYKYQKASSQELNWEVFRNEPFFPSYATIESAEAAYKNVLSDVGCTLPYFDLHDQRMVKETKTRTFTVKGSRSGKKGLIDSEEDEGCEGFDLGKLGITTSSRDADWDTDGDGIPNWFEQITGTNPSVANNNEDRDGDYYTDLEEYLNWISAPNFRIDGHLSLPMEEFFAGYDAPAYTIEGIPAGVTASLSEGILSISATEASPKLFTLEVKAEENGISMTRSFHFAYANGQTGIVAIPSDDACAKQHPSYDLSGRRLLTVPVTKGIYIQKGKKIIVK